MKKALVLSAGVLMSFVFLVTAFNTTEMGLESISQSIETDGLGRIAVYEDNGDIVAVGYAKDRANAVKNAIDNLYCHLEKTGESVILTENISLSPDVRKGNVVKVAVRYRR